MRNIRALVAAVVMALFTASCSPLLTDVSSLSSDAMHGRDNRQWGSTRAQNYLIGQLKTFAIGLDSSRPGDDSFKQPFAAGTNVLALIPGAQLANEYVIVGAHYDHLGSSCRTGDPADTSCNGATDNARASRRCCRSGGRLRNTGRRVGL